MAFIWRTTLRDVFEKNMVLEDLALHSGADSLRDKYGPFHFFGTTHTILKSLTIAVGADSLEDQVAALCIDTLASLEDNTSLERLGIKRATLVGPEEYLVALELLPPNTTLN
jgi:hypothetical protein